MGKFLAALILGIGVTSAHAQLACDTSSDLKGSKQPAAFVVLEELKGTVAMGGNNVCSGALVTFTGRTSFTPALVLSAAHCSDRGKVQIPMGNGSLAMPDRRGSVLPCQLPAASHTGYGRHGRATHLRGGGRDRVWHDDRRGYLAAAAYRNV